MKISLSADAIRGMKDEKQHNFVEFYEAALKATAGQSIDRLKWLYFYSETKKLAKANNGIAIWGECPDCGLVHFIRSDSKSVHPFIDTLPFNRKNVSNRTFTKSVFGNVANVSKYSKRVLIDQTVNNLVK